MPVLSRPENRFEPRPFASQTQVSFEAPSTLVFDKKFDTAIRSSHLEQHYERVRSDHTTLDDRLTQQLPNYPPEMASHDVASAVHAKLMLDGYGKSIQGESPRMHNPGIPNRTNRQLHLAFANLEFQVAYLNKNNELDGSRNSMRELNRIKHIETQDLTYLNILADYCDWLQGVINMSNAMYADYYKGLSEDEYVEDLKLRNTATYTPFGITISWSHNYCTIKHDNTSVLLPRSYILLLHNKVCDLISVYIYSRMARHSSLPETFVDKVVDTCVELWTIVKDYGQDGFSVAKCLEAFASAETLVAIENWDNSEFLKVVTKDLREDTGFDYMTSTLRSIWKNESPAVMHELACLSKIAGHPLVDMEAGVQKIHKYTTEEYTLNYDKITESVGYIKQNYIRNFIVRNGRWPKHDPIPRIAPDALRYGSLLNEDPEGHRMLTKYGPLKPSDYNFVELGQEMKFNYLENVIPHLKDKTISALRSHVVKQYINNADVRTSWSDTRLLLYYLLHDGKDVDHTEFLKEYANGADLEEFSQYLVIRIVPKEKELKIQFRGFGCTTFHNRMLFLAQEKTAMEYLDLYCDEQAMTLSELDLVKRLYSFRCLLEAYPRYAVLYLMVDAAAWNTHFRKETVDIPMKQTLDPITGTKTFGSTQHKYEYTLFYVPDGDTTYHWYGQNGGIEGLNQDTWVIIYIGQIKTALSGLDVKFHILCKGDDLRIAILVPLDDPRIVNMAEFKADIMTRLHTTMKDMGHNVKIFDSYGSTRYFSFSKVASVDKVELSQVLRKIQKCYGATNAFLPTLEDYIGSTFSNAHSACRVTTTAVSCFFVALYWAYYYLLSDERTPAEKKRKERALFAQETGAYERLVMRYSDLTDSELKALLLVPSVCGGFPIIHLHNMFVRAESDLFPAFLDIIEFARVRRDFDVFECLKNFLHFDARKKTTWRPLYKDMYAMPIMKPETASFVLRKSLIGPLRRITTCDELTELFDLIENDEGSARVVQCLDSCAQVHAKVFALIFESLPESLLDEILRKFETARSVMELLILRKGKRYCSRVLKRVLVADRYVSQWRLQRLKGIHGDSCTNGYRYYLPCPAEFAYKLREVYWSKPVLGITMPPMGHVVGFCTMAQAYGNAHIRANHFTFRVEPPTRFLERAQGNFHYGHGSKRPFLGHRTGTGTVNPLLHLVTKDKFLSRLRNLAELASWVQTTDVIDGVEVTSNIYAVIAIIVKLYTREELTSFAPFLGGRRSGTVAHHVRTRHFREAIVPNSLSNLYQFVEGESNTHRKFFGDRGHYWINFLQIYCHSVVMMFIELNVLPYFTTPATVWAYTANCDFCLREVSEQPIVVNTDYLGKVKFPQLQLTKMGANALEVLRESLDLSRDRRHNLEGHNLDLTIQQATLGCLKIILDTTVEATQRISDRFTHHPGSRSANLVLRALVPNTKRRIIGQRELTLLDNETLCSIVPFLIVQLMFRYLHRSALTNLPDSLHAVPPTTLPWYELMHELARVGRLHYLSVGISAMVQRYPYHLTFKPEQVSAYLGSLSFEAIGQIGAPIDLIILSDYELTTVRRHVREHLHLLAWGSFRDRLAASQDAEERIEIFLISLLTDYAIVGVQFLDEADDELTSSGQHQGADIINIDLVQEQLIKFANGDDTRVELLGQRHHIYSKYTHVGLAAALDTYDVDPEIIHAEVIEWLRDVQINIVSTTSQACLLTLREKGTPFRAEPRALDDFIAGVKTFRQACRPHFRHPSYATVIPPASTNPDDHSGVLVQPIIRREDYLPCSSHLWRPYGVNNATVSHLCLIFHSLQLEHSNVNFDNLSVSLLGDGIGNGTLFFAQHGRGMRLVFTTRPDSQLLHTTPKVALEEIEMRQHVLYNDHIAAGIWDLRERETYDGLYEMYGRHDIYFCDAERAPGETGFDTIYYEATRYYLMTRREDALFVLQVSADDSDAVSRCLALLSMRCTHVYICHPPSILCYLTHYIVAYGSRTALGAIDPRDINVTPRHAQVLQAYYRRVAERHNEEIREAASHLVLSSQMYRMPNYRHSVPPLWTSLVNKELGLIVAEDVVTQLVAQSSGHQAHWTIPLLGQLHTWREANYIRSTLNAAQPDRGNPLQNPGFNIDYHANRIVRLNRFMTHWGFNWALNLYQRGEHLIREADLKTSFLLLYRSLSPRDRVVPERHINFYSRYYTTPTGYRIEYWLKFINGVRMVQLLSSWMSAIQQR